MHTWKDLEKGRWSDYEWTAPAHGGCAIDPYLAWADLTRFADLGRLPTWIPVILRLTGSAGALVDQINASSTLREYIRIAPMYKADPALAEAKFCTAAVKSAVLAALGKDAELKGRIEQLQLGLPISGVETTHLHGGVDGAPGGRRDADSANEAPVVVGVIDDGFAFAHQRFRKPGTDRTRIQAFWDQGEGWNAPNRPGRRASASPAEHPDEAEVRLPGVPYGTELLKGEINRRIRDSTHAAGVVDEDEVYRLCGYRGVELRASHGTHVMDLACGCGPGEARPKTRLPHIICVALPRQTTGDTSGLSLGVYALDALRYILDRADRLVPGAKVVVNLSYGAIAGPHDGTSLLEAAIDNLIQLRRASREPERDSLEVVIAAGNNHLSRCHAHLELAPGAAQTLEWRILPDDETPSFMEIWLAPDAVTDGVIVRLTAPTGAKGKPVQAGQVHGMTDGEDVVAAVVHQATGGRRMILVAIAPTATTHRTRRVAPSGRWRVEIQNGSARELELDAWIQRDDNVHGFRRRGRQSAFDDREYERLDANGRPVEEDQPKSYVRRAGTLNSIGTGNETIVAGGYRGSDGAPALYSARGPDDPPDGVRAGPDAMEVSERSISRRGVLAAGARSGSTLAMNGTSVAAPQLTRWIAEQMIAGEPAGLEAVHARAKRDDPDPKRPTTSKPVTALPRPDVRPKPPAGRGGAGRIRSAQRGEDRPDTFRPFGRR